MNKLKPYLFWIRIGMTVLLLAFIVVLQMGGKTSKTEIGQVSEAVTKAVDMSSMQESTNRMFKKFYGLNANDYEGIVLYSPVTNMDAEEILIVKLKKNSQSKEVEAAIKNRLEKQKASFEGYGIEQYDLLEKHILDVRGNYILYIVHPDAQTADRVFRDSL